ncbi:MAG TPA: DUF2283 domain-containing protein [Rhodothermales bacterium]
MRVEYFTKTDTLYIQLQEGPGADAQEVAKDVVLDFGPDGSVVGIEIENASARMDLTGLKRPTLPIDVV